MKQEAYCPEHGSYDASLGACPYPHNGGSPKRGMPTSLQDDLPTDLGAGGGGGATSVGGRRFNNQDEDATAPPMQQGRRGILDFDAEDETQLPAARRDEDATELEAPTKGALGMLWVKEGPRRGKFYPVRHGTLIGRKDGDLMLNDPKVSSSHAKITIEDEDFYIWDFGSANGTHVNGKKIRGATLLNENDLVRIGETIFIFKRLEPKPQDD